MDRLIPLLEAARNDPGFYLFLANLSHASVGREVRLTTDVVMEMTGQSRDIAAGYLALMRMYRFVGPDAGDGRKLVEAPERLAQYATAERLPCVPDGGSFRCYSSDQAFRLLGPDWFAGLREVGGIHARGEGYGYPSSVVDRMVTGEPEDEGVGVARTSAA